MRDFCFSTRRLMCACCWLALSAAVSCTGSDASPNDGPPGSPAAGSPAKDPAAPEPVDEGTPVSVALSSLQTEQADALMASSREARTLTADQLRARRARKHVTSLGYDPKAAQGFDLIQKSALGLSDAEQKALQERGFVVGRHAFSTMLEGYAAIYVHDLPLYVSSDSILDSVYRSYDKILMRAEQGVLSGALSDLLNGMRASLAAKYSRHKAAADADLYLAVAKSLLDGAAAKPVAGASASTIAELTQSAELATGHSDRVLFGVKRDIDFSQFTPRSHYVLTTQLEHYFRAMMWLGRIELHLIETTDTGEQLFHRRPFEAAVLLRQLARDNDQSFTRIDRTLEAFVGKSDYMRLPEIDALLSDLGVTVDTLGSVDDQRVAQMILDKGYGVQKIASQIIVNATADQHTLPLDRSFALFGQRYTVDSHVFSNVVYDRVAGRLMPNPLDVAYAALGNDSGASLLGPDLPSYAGALESTRLLVDAHDEEFWAANLYNSWLKALRALSPAPDGDKVREHGMPAITGTEAWDRRIVNTQLSSWAQLRHNTVLYAKQSFTSMPGCAYPDAYVEPYPEFFRALGAYAQQGKDLAEVLAGDRNDQTTERLRSYFDNLGTAMKVLGDMAQLQREGKPFTSEQMVFINQAVVAAGALYVCAGPATFSGWYAKLDYDVLEDGRSPSEIKPVITDVHTQPADEAGNDVGRILHVGTGLPRLMVTTVDTCQGPRAYAGLAASYYETTTDNWKRLTDAEWTQRVKGEAGPLPADPAWASGFMAP